MKKLAFCATALTLIAGSAVAADLPSYKAPPPPPPPPLWTGFYVGLNAGAAWAESNAVNVASAPVWRAGNIRLASVIGAAAAGTSNTPASSAVGFIGGGQIGYNWQFYSRFVAGLEADIQGIANNSSRNAGMSAAPTLSGGNFWLTSTQTSRNVDYLGTVRGRLGWLFTPTLLLYGTGGLAYGGTNFNASVAWAGVRNGGGNFAAPGAFFGGQSYSDTCVGWTAGGGVEWMFWPNWSAKAEYLYYDLGSVTRTFATVRTQNSGPAFLLANQASTRFNGHIVRAGLNYHFNWGAAPSIVNF